MMTFQAFLVRLAQGQLKNTSAVADSQMGVIKEEYHEAILGLTNQGLVDICSKMPIIKSFVDLTFVDGQSTYHLIKDAPYLSTSYDGEMVKVLDVIQSDGEKHTVDSNAHISTPTYNTLWFSQEMMKCLGPKIRVEYQALHPKVADEGVINIPPNMETALQLFVSSLYISHMNGPDHSKKGDSYMAAYLRHLGGDEERNTSSTSEVQEDTRFSDRGFV